MKKKYKPKEGSQINTQNKWLLLIHNIPPKPPYLRMKVGKRLRRAGAVAIKNSVYILPKSEQSMHAFQWILKEVLEGKGEATLCEANLIEGLDEVQIVDLFNKERNSDYKEIGEQSKSILKRLPSRGVPSDEKKKEIETNLLRLKRQLSEIVSIDFFGAEGRQSAEGLLGEIDKRLRGPSLGTKLMNNQFTSIDDLKGKTWVTRREIHVDRIASAWLIQRFIDAKAKFKYIDAKAYRPKANELRFDMLEAEFTHEGDLCTFEVLINRTNLKDRALREIAEIVHEIDIEDETYVRGDIEGVGKLINGICILNGDDTTRLTQGSILFDALYEYFRRKRN